MALVFLYNKEMQSKELRPLFSYMLPKLEEILFITVLIACLLLGSRMLSIDSDLGRHLTLGNYILETTSIPTKDILSHTKPSESRPPYEWGSQILFAIVYKAAGLDGVIFLCGIIIATTFFLIYKNSIKVNRLPILSIGIVILGLVTSSIHWLPRPHVFTFLLLYIWTRQLEKIREFENTKLWHLPLIMLVWANMHGGFIFGFLVWFAYLVGDLWEKVVSGKKSKFNKLLQVGALSVMASMITPDGWGNWLAVLGNNSQYILRNTVETMSPDFYQPDMLPFLILLGLTFVIPTISKTQLHASHIFLISGMAMASLVVARNIPLFVIVTTPILCECLMSFTFSGFWGNLESRIYSLQSQIKGYWILLLVFLISFLMFVKYNNYQISIVKFNPSIFPVQAVEWLRENPQAGNMFNEFNWGGYIEFRLFPEQKVFLDSQTDFYGEALIRDYEKIISANPEWEHILEEYNTNWILINKNSPLAFSLKENRGWELLYQDQLSVIYRKID